MSKLGKKIIEAAKEAVAIARGEKKPARIYTFAVDPGGFTGVTVTKWVTPAEMAEHIRQSK